MEEPEEHKGIRGFISLPSGNESPPMAVNWQLIRIVERTVNNGCRLTFAPDHELDLAPGPLSGGLLNAFKVPEFTEEEIKRLHSFSNVRIVVSGEKGSDDDTPEEVREIAPVKE